MLTLKTSHYIKESVNALRVPFGLKDGRMYEPRQVLIGKSCACICPSCESPLIAKHSLKGGKIPHFSHVADKNCIYGRESAIHLAAKQLIQEHGKFYLPELTVGICVVDEMGIVHSPQKTLITSGIKEFKNVRLEQSVSDFRPDLIGTTVNGNDLLIEIAVTHFVDDAKQSKIERHGTAAIEVDASQIPAINFEALAKLLFEPSPHTNWLFHPRYESTRLALHEKLIPTLVAAKIESDKNAHNLHLQQLQQEKKFKEEMANLAILNQVEERRQIEVKKQKIRKIEEFKAMSVSQKLAYSLLCLNLDEGAIPFFLNQKVRCEQSFRVPRVNWQLAVFGAFIQKRLKLNNHTFRSDEVVSWLEQRFDINVNPKYPNSHKVAIWDFLTKISELGILNYIGHRTFEVEQNDLKEIIVGQHGIPPNLSKVGLSDFHLEWVSGWPNRNQIESILDRYQRKYSSICNWERLADLRRDAKNRTPHEIAKIYSYREDNSIEILLKFMIEAKFVKAVTKN